MSWYVQKHLKSSLKAEGMEIYESRGLPYEQWKEVKEAGFSLM